MLGYIFSHRAATGVDPDAYEAGLRRFHESLASSLPSGFVASSSFRIGDLYSDWYLLETAAALDSLNWGAVSGTAAAPHDVMARMASHGEGKLMTLVSGDPTRASSYEVRFSKPPGTSYAELDHMLAAFKARPGTSLWRRMMVLGPPPEFCLVSPAPLELPEGLEPRVYRREAI